MLPRRGAWGSRWEASWMWPLALSAPPGNASGGRFSSLAVLVRSAPAARAIAAPPERMGQAAELFNARKPLADPRPVSLIKPCFPSRAYRGELEMPELTMDFTLAMVLA